VCTLQRDNNHLRTGRREDSGHRFQPTLRPLTPATSEMDDGHNRLRHGAYGTGVTPENRELPLVTVGLPTYNRLSSLERAVDSVLAQDYPSLELIVSDNASDDGTESFGRDLAARHPNVRYVRNSTNVGPTANLNSVRAAAHGSYFMWLGDDDWLDPSYISHCTAALEGDPNAVLATGEVRYFDDSGPAGTGVRVSLRQRDPPRRVAAYFGRVRDNGTFYGVMRRSAVNHVPDLANDMGDDWVFVASLAFVGRVLAVDGVSVHRALGGTTSSLANVARVRGNSPFAREFPQLAMAGFVAAQIGRRSPVFAPMGRIRRSALGAWCAVVVVLRFVPGKIPKYLRLKVTALRRRKRSS
jgi:hypothetical protein